MEARTLHIKGCMIDILSSNDHGGVNGGVTVHCVGDLHIHREDGPAVIYDNGLVEYFIMDKLMGFDEYCRLTTLSAHQKLYLKIRYSETTRHLTHSPR